MDPAGEPALLVLEDGSVHPGRSVGAPGERCFELVFNTAMTGYQEILTDPSYRGQGVVMTYPQIGNSGTCAADDESGRCWAEALIVHQMAPVASNWRSECSLPDYLRRHGVPAIAGVDTRDLTLRLREQGALRAVLSTERDDAEALLAAARAHPPTEGRNLAAEVSCAAPYAWAEPVPAEFAPPGLAAPAGPPLPLTVVDFGVKRNILRSLVGAGFAPRVVPWNASPGEILAGGAAAVFLSNGPGDPAAVREAHENLRQVAGTGTPMLGICLGHQILAHVFGGRTEKMKFGHHGANHPVIELAGGRIDITSQNHSYAVAADSLAGTGLEVTHRNGNDGTVEGMRHRELPVFSVQYHPEAAPGPHDAAHLFVRFRELAGARTA
ncbi:MAG: carbamoyl-phosphate synthase small subunit [Planctomycetota bacterium]|nr:MAG: carbamoyl-phosphate synthase small subunit [Planctomycetota bacterium]